MGDQAAAAHVQLALYERIVETTSEGVWVIDAENRTTFVNQSMATMLGYERQELVGRSVFDLMDAAHRAGAEAGVERRKQGISEAHEFIFRRKDGRPLWARLSTNALLDGAGVYRGALALVTDLSLERLRDQERQRLWRIVDEAINEVYLFWEGDLRIEYANRAALQNTGFTLSEMRERTPLDLKPSLTAESFSELLAPLVDGSRPKVIFRTDQRRHDGSSYPVEVHVQLVPGPERLFAATVNDISERVAAERALRANEGRFRALIEHSLDLLLLADPSGRFTFASPSSKAILGYTPDELLRLAPLELIHPDDQPVASAALVTALPDQITERIEFRVRHRDGSWRTLSGNACNLLNAPEVGALVLNARDVTHERKLEEQLQQSQRLESIGRLAGGVAHDFNNILTTILGGAEFLAADPSLSETAVRDVRDIQAAGERAAELTNQLLAFARKRIIRPQSLSLGEAIASHKRFLVRVLGGQIELTTSFDSSLWPVHVDATQLEQVIVNLAVNARDAMKDGGRLRLEAKNVTLDESFAGDHPEVKPGDYVSLTVSDSGEGIPADLVPHIFEPFFTTKAVGAGSGLGLATVYGIVRQSEGHIFVSSEPGVGTTFRLYLPRAPSATTEAHQPTQIALARGAEHVLVVEDDATVRQLVVRTLEGAGYAVHSEPTPAGGLEWARGRKGNFDLLITDVAMPGMSGRQLASVLCAEFPKVRVLFVSGYAENAIGDRGVLEQGVNFLGKPFSPSVLRARVREVLDQR